MSYTIAWYATIAVTVIGVIAGVLSTSGYTGARPSWLTSDLSATFAVIATICVALGGALPALLRTPAAREQSYLTARNDGKLPDDLEQKHGPLP